MTLGSFFLFVEGQSDMAHEGIRTIVFGAGIALLAVGTVGIHIELGRFFGMLGMMPTMTYGIASGLAAGIASLILTLLGPMVCWLLAFVMPALIVVLFRCARLSAFPNQCALYRESTIELLIPYRFLATSVTQGLALGIPLGFASASGVFFQELDAASYVVAAILAFLTVLTFQMDFNQSIYRSDFLSLVPACSLQVSSVHPRRPLCSSRQQGSSTWIWSSGGLVHISSRTAINLPPG